MAPKAAAATAAEAERKAKEKAGGSPRGKGNMGKGGNMGGVSRLMSRTSSPGKKQPIILTPIRQYINTSLNDPLNTSDTFHTSKQLISNNLFSGSPPTSPTEVRDPWGKGEKKGEKKAEKKGEKKEGGGAVSSIAGEGGDGAVPSVYAYSCTEPDGTISYQYHSFGTTEQAVPLPFSANVQEAEWQTMIGNAFMALGKLHKAMDCFLEGGLWLKGLSSVINGL